MALLAAQEAKLIAPVVAVVVAAGARVPGGWRHPAMNANSSKKAVIVVATARSLFHHFLPNGHGQSWFKKIRFLVLLDPAGLIGVGAEHCFNRVIRAITPKERRKSVVIKTMDDGPRPERVGVMIEKVLREKRTEVMWGNISPISEKPICTDDTDHMDLDAPSEQEWLVPRFINHDVLHDIELTSERGADHVSPLVESMDFLTNKHVMERSAEDQVGSPSNVLSGQPANDDAISADSNPSSKSIAKHANEVTQLTAKASCIEERVMVSDWAALYHTLLTQLQESQHKENDERILVIFPTSRLVELYASMCRSDGISLQDLHKRTSAARRERALEWMFGSNRGIMFASDVVTSGVVLPRVDRIVQIGASRSVSVYENRLSVLADGGESVLMMGGREADVVIRELEGAGRDILVYRDFVEGGVWQGDGVDMNARGRAYLSWISWWLIGRSRFEWNKRDVIAFVNEWATQLFGEVPIVENRIVKKMTVHKMEGLRVIVRPPVRKVKNKVKKPVKKKKKALQVQSPPVEREVSVTP